MTPDWSQQPEVQAQLELIGRRRKKHQRWVLCVKILWATGLVLFVLALMFVGIVTPQLHGPAGLKRTVRIGAWMSLMLAFAYTMKLDETRRPLKLSETWLMERLEDHYDVPHETAALFVKEGKV